MSVVAFSRACGRVLSSAAALDLPPKAYTEFQVALIRASGPEDLSAEHRRVFDAGSALREAYDEKLHPRNRVGEWAKVMNRLHTITRTDVVAGMVPGMKYDPDVSPHIAAHMHHEHITLGPAAFRDMGVEVEHVSPHLLAHEIGHVVGGSIIARGDISKIPELQAFRGEGETMTRGVGYMPTYENPFGLSTRPEEILADAYAELLFMGAGEQYEDHESEYVQKRVALLKLIQKAAKDLGLPAERTYRMEASGPVDARVYEWLPVQEAVYVEGLHPRNRLGRWRKKLVGLPSVKVSGRTVNLDGATAEQAEVWFKRRYPDKTFDFEGADMTITGPALTQFAKLAELFPFAVKNMGGIIMARTEGDPDHKDYMDRNAHAGVRTEDSMVLLNRLSWGDPEKFLDELELAEMAEWHPPDCATPVALMTHEFGHLIDRALTRPHEATSIEMMGASEVAWMEPYSPGWDGYGKVSGTWTHWKEDTDKEAVSGYAMAGARDSLHGSENERVAEAFASVFHTPDELKDEYVRRFEALLHDIADESKWVPATNDRAVTFEGERSGGRPPLTEADREQWKEERLRWKARMSGPLWTLKNMERLYVEMYGNDYKSGYHKEVSELRSRRHARSAELRERLQARKIADDKAKADAATARRQAELDKWVPRRDELMATGLTGPEVLEKLKSEGFDERLMRQWYDPDPPSEWAK